MSDRLDELLTPNKLQDKVLKNPDKYVDDAVKINRIMAKSVKIKKKLNATKEVKESMDKLDELFGKGSLPTIGKFHSDASQKATSGTKEKAIHSLNRNRASRLHNVARGQSPIGKPDRKLNLQYSKEDSAKARKLRSEETVTEDINAAGKKKLSTFERLQRKTRHYLINRDNNIVTRANAGHSHDQIAKDMGVHPAIVGAVIGAERSKVRKEHIVKRGKKWRLLSHTGKNLGTFDNYAAAAKHEGEVEWFKKHQKEEVVNEISQSTKASYAEKARPSFDNAATKRFTPGTTPEEQQKQIKIMGKRSKGLDRVFKTRNEETVTEEHKVIATYTPNRSDHHFKGDRYELHAHNPGHKSEWHSIVKTHQGGKSLQNQWGGYSGVKVGAPKYIAGKWKALKATHDNPNVRSFAPAPVKEERNNRLFQHHQKFTQTQLASMRKARDKGTRWEKAKTINDPKLGNIRIPSDSVRKEGSEFFKDHPKKSGHIGSSISSKSTWQLSPKQQKERDEAEKRVKLAKDRSGRERNLHIIGARGRSHLNNEGTENAFAKLAKKISNKSLNQWLKAKQTPTFGAIQDKGRGIKNDRSSTT